MNQAAEKMKALLNDKEVWQDGWGFRLQGMGVAVYDPRTGEWEDSKGSIELDWDEPARVTKKGEHLTFNKAIAAMFDGKEVRCIRTGAMCWFVKDVGIMCTYNGTMEHEFDPTDNELTGLWEVLR